MSSPVHLMTEKCHLYHKETCSLVDSIVLACWFSPFPQRPSLPLPSRTLPTPRIALPSFQATTSATFPSPFITRIFQLPSWPSRAHSRRRVVGKKQKRKKKCTDVNAAITLSLTEFYVPEKNCQSFRKSTRRITCFPQK